jgi:electron transfer flavoprotein alpha subunit
MVMGLSKVWVFGEANDGKVATITLEMLAKARSLSDDVAVVYGGSDADAVAATFGEHGASTVFATGDHGGGLQGVAVASALAAAIAAGDGPAAILFGTTQDGRDVAGRLSAKIDAPVITNVVDLEVTGDKLVGTEPVFGGVTNVKTTFTTDKPQIVLVRP